jgi:hypothetical protein
MKNKEPWAPKKIGRPKMTPVESDDRLVLETYKEQNLERGA